MAYKYPKFSGLVVRNPQGVIMKSKTMALSINLLYKDAILFGEEKKKKMVSKLNRIENQCFPLQGNWTRQHKSALPTATGHKILQDVN